NADTRLVQAHPKNADEIIRTWRKVVIVLSAHTIIEHPFIVTEPRPNVRSENFPCAHRRWQSFRSRRNRKHTDELIVIENLQKVLVRIDKNLSRSERRVFWNFALSEFLNLKGQYIWYLQSFARLEMFPVLSRIELLNIGFGRMISLGDELEQGCIRQPLQFRLLGTTARNITHQLQIFIP